MYPAAQQHAWCQVCSYRRMVCTCILLLSNMHGIRCAVNCSTTDLQYTQVIENKAVEFTEDSENS